MNIATFNQLSLDERRTHLVACCHCEAWADRVLEQSPFENTDQLCQVADDAWRSASEAEILEAFEGHPQIGDLSALRNKYAATASAEQGQVTEADESVLVALRDQNQAYLDKFGFIFIVCASGKSAEEMLQLLSERIVNDRQTELRNGATEQGKITQLRLQKLIADGS